MSLTQKFAFGDNSTKIRPPPSLISHPSLIRLAFTSQNRSMSTRYLAPFYDPELERHSDDPSNPEITRRVLTIGMADDY
jgi:hypothetical protein